MTPEEIKELQDELRIANILIAKLTDQCRELEAHKSRPDREKIVDYLSLVLLPDDIEVKEDELVSGRKVYFINDRRKEELADQIIALFDEDCPTCQGKGLYGEEDLGWFVGWMEEKGTPVVAETDRILLKFVEHNKPNALLLDITDIQNLKKLAEGK